MVTLPDAGTVPTSTATVMSPATLPLVTVPCVVVTKPMTRGLFTSGVSLKTTPVAAELPALTMTIWYCRRSPGETSPSESLSSASVTVFLARSSGAPVTWVTVGLLIPPTDGSSVSSVGNSLLATVP